MSNPFAAVQTALNAATVAAIGNATLTWGAYSAGGVFDAAYQDTLGLGNAAPQFRALSSALPGIAAGQAVSVGVTAYTVREVRPDGTGLLTLILEAA